MAEIALINGNAYYHSGLTVSILGVPIPSVSSLNYSVAQTKENNYGTGSEPISRGRGSKTYTGSIELSMNDVEAIRGAVGTRDLVDIPPFDIVIVWVSVGNTTRVHTLENCEFMNDGVETSTDDTDVLFTFDLIIGKIRKA